MSNVADKIFFRGEHTCPWWLCFTFDNPLRYLVHNPWKILSKYIVPESSILDVGPGKGYFTLPMALMAHNKGKVVALDIQEQMLKSINRKAIRKRITNLNTKLYDGDNFEITEQFDLVIIP